MVEQVISNPISVLFLIIAIGHAMGRVSIRGVALGSSTVLFVALLFGYLGMGVPGQIADLGVILFVYSIGLQAGPRFFGTFQSRGLRFAQVGLATIVTAALLTWVASALLDLPVPLAVGMFSGALTSTPGLAAALDTLADPLVPVGYGIAYPIGVIGVVVFVQIIPAMLRNATPSPSDRLEDMSKPKEAVICCRKYRVENPRCAGKRLSELKLHGMTKANISRVRHGDSVSPARPDTILCAGDVILAVGLLEELAKLECILGPPTEAEMETSREVVARDVYVSDNRVAGKTISDLHVSESFGVVISRVSREDLELVPTGTLRLEIGDLIRVVGAPADCEAFIKFVGEREKRVHETTILPFSIGIVLGIALAYLPIPLPGGITIRLGLAGGPLFVGLLLGYFGGIGRLRLHTPYAVRYLLRELGLVFFLAGAGTRAGAQFVDVLKNHGVTLLLAGAVVTIIPMAAAFLLSRMYHRFDLSTSLGAVCGSMTSTPGLGAVCNSLQSDDPALAYAAVYPVSLITVTVAAQVLAMVLR